MTGGIKPSFRVSAQQFETTLFQKILSLSFNRFWSSFEYFTHGKRIIRFSISYSFSACWSHEIEVLDHRGSNLVSEFIGYRNSYSSRMLEGCR